MTKKSSNKTKVLVVDDDSFFLNYITHFFNHKEYEVITASGGDEAVEHARRVRPHLIILDLEMPDRDGIETCKVLKADAATREIPVIIVTATDDAELNQKAFNAGAQATILKTVSRERLLNLVEVAVSTKIAAPSDVSHA